MNSPSSRTVEPTQALVARLFEALRVADSDADSVVDGYPTGLRWLHGHLGRSGKDTTEDAISEALAACLPGEGGIVAARTQVPYPPRLRALGDGVTRGTCDLVLDLADGTHAWIEVKGAWPYLREGAGLKRNSSYLKHLVSPTEGAVRDFAKLAPLSPQEAGAVGVLVLGFDIDDPGSPWEIADVHLAELERSAGVESGGWGRHDACWQDVHAARVYGDERRSRCRTRCFLWLRTAARPLLTQLSGMLRNRNAIDAQIAALIGRPAERGHIGEFVAAEVFDIELHANATNPGSDGVFRSGPLAGKTVNVKLYGAQEGLLDVSGDRSPDYYLVMTGAKRTASAPRATSRPLVIEHVFVFGHADLLASGVRPGTSASVRQALWEAAQVFPTPGEDARLLLAVDQLAALKRFSSEPAPSRR